MNILIMSPKSEFSKDQQKRLTRIGEVVYTKNRDKYPLRRLIELARDAEILAFDPDNIGGFEKAPARLAKLMDAMPRIKVLALDTTAYGYVDLDYCRKRKIIVSNVPYYSTESVAEQTITFLLGAAKRIFITDRRTQKGKYHLEEGFEMKGKTLGVIGLGHIGTRVAELGLALGMRVIAYNRTRKKVKGVKLMSFDWVLKNADFLSINLAENRDTKGIISKEKIVKMKKGVIVVNTADRTLVDEKAMAEALKREYVDTYLLEAEDLKSPPLGGIENAIFFKGFGWYTREALERNKQIWVDNILHAVKGKYKNRVN